MANIFEINRPANKITLGTTGTTINIASHTASLLLSLDASKDLQSVSNLTSWIAGTTDHISVADDGDGTVTLDLDTNTQTLLGSFNGIFLEKLNFTISETAGTVTGKLEQDGTGDLIQKFSDGYTTLDCTPKKEINLTGYVGSNAVPKQVFVYILQSAKTVIAASNSDWPATEHIRIANLLLKDATTTGNDGGALVNRNWNDHAFASDSQGHITHIEDRIRQEPSQWNSGVALTLKNSAGAALTTGNSSTAVEIVTAVGTVYQLHKHTFPAFDMYTTATDDVHVVNQPTDEGGAYETTANLISDIAHYDDGSASGVAIGVNKYFNLVIWGVQNRSGEASHVMINLPTGQYTTEANAISDTNGTSVFNIPAVFKGVGFLIARLTFRLIAGSQWTYIAQEDLRGQIPPTTAGVSVTTTDHALLANVTSDQHHTESHAIASHNDTSGTGAELNELTDGSETILHSHAGGADAFTVKIDAGATAGYIGVASGDGVLRTTTGLSYVDGGDFVTLGLSHLGLESLVDPDVDRVMFWDDSETALKWLTVIEGVQINGTKLQFDVNSLTEITSVDGTADYVVVFDTSEGNPGYEHKKVLVDNLPISSPVGSMVIWTTDTAPSGWLLCYGQAVSRTATYDALFTVIGTTFGVGDGSTTFNLPDMRGRFPLGQDDMGGGSADRVTNAQADSLGGAEGAETHTLSENEMPSHTHDILTGWLGIDVNIIGTDSDGQTEGRTNVSQSTGGDGAHNNMSPYLTLNYIIKY